MTYSIMIVDDTVILAQAIAEMLRMEGFRVTHFTNGVEALAVLDQGKYDLIISDLRMPVMDGIEFVKQVRGGSSTIRDIPIIVLSAQTGEASKLACTRVGANLFLTKPFDEEELVSSINHLLFDSSHRTVWS